MTNYILINGKWRHFSRFRIDDVMDDDNNVRWRATETGWVDMKPKAGDATRVAVGQGLSTGPLPKSSNPKHAAGLTKPPLDLVPAIGEIEQAMVFDLSAGEYGPFNWRDAEVVRSIYIAAIGRHYAAMKDGQDLDPKTGRPHLAHIMANCNILLDAAALGKLIDDRHTAGPAPDILAKNTKKST